jgi:hypothetical protein
MFMFLRLADIPRVTALEPQTGQITERTELSSPVFLDAHRRLGYAGAAAESTNAQKVKARESLEQRLTESLLAVGIHPLNAASVRTYKAQTYAKRWLKATFLQLGVLALLGIPSYTSLLKYDSMCIVVAFFASLGIWLTIQPANWSWQEEQLHGYDRPIPQAVLSVALRAFDVAPRGRLHVHEFRERSHVADPFLVLHIDDVRIFLAAWEEPSFRSAVV